MNAKETTEKIIEGLQKQTWTVVCEQKPVEVKSLFTGDNDSLHGRTPDQGGQND